jgi:hypothetical protein
MRKWRGRVRKTWAEPAAEPARVLDVLVDGALRIDHGCLPTGLVRDQMRRVGEAAEVVLLQDYAPTGTFVGSATIRM